MQYNAAFTEPRSILSDDDKSRLHALAERFPLERFKIDTRTYEESIVSFVYTNARIEGNAYSKPEADELLRRGITAGGRQFSDALMLLNLLDGFKQAANATPDTQLGVEWLTALHGTVMRGLLPDAERGTARTRAVAISASNYQPLIGARRLRGELARILPQAGRYADPFERAIYLHCNLAYLQYFQDGNKRCARLLQTAALMQDKVLPLFFEERAAEAYLHAIIAYYERGDYAPYVAFFMENYARSVSRLTGDYLNADDIGGSEEFRRRIAQLPKLENATGAAYTFWRLVQESMVSANSADRDINWPAIERQTIIDSIALYGQSPDNVANALCTYSPGACTPEAQEALRDEIRRLAPTLRQQAAARR